MKSFKEILTEAIKPDEQKFIDAYIKIFVDSYKRELEKWGKSSADIYFRDGIQEYEIWNILKIYKRNTQIRILNNLENSGLIKTNRQSFNKEVKKKYNFGKDVVYKTGKEVDIKILPNGKTMEKIKNEII